MVNTRMRGVAAALISGLAALLMTGAVAPSAAAAGLTGGPGNPHPIVTFAHGSFPESIFVSGRDSYVTLGFIGKLVRVTDGRVATVATVQVGTESTLTGVVVTGGYAYFARAPFAGGPAYLYRVATTARNATPKPWVTLAADGSFPNGLAVRHGVLYVADSAAGIIRTVSLRDGAVSAWCASGLLKPKSPDGFGVNGITFRRGGALYGVVSDFGRVTRITRTHGGGCTVTTVLERQQLVSADGVAFGPEHRLYVTVNATNTVQAVNLATKGLCTVAGPGGLSYPTQVAFPREHTMYVTSGAYASGVPAVVSFRLR